MEVDCDQDNFCWGESLRLKIRIDITKPPRRGIWIDLGGDQKSIWIQARYERLLDFCYSCGQIGHMTKEWKMDLGNVDMDTKSP